MLTSALAYLVLAGPPATEPAAPPPPAAPVIPEGEAKARVLEAELAGERRAAEIERVAASARAAAATAEAESDRAKAKQKEAEEEKVEAKEETEESKDELAQEKSAKLMELGITLGVALAVQAPLDGDPVRQETAGVTSMPYFMVHPGYWGAGPSTRKYCASHWSGKSAVDASRAADALAREQAGLRMEALLNAIRVDEDIALAELQDKALRGGKRRAGTASVPKRLMRNLTQPQLDTAKEIVKLETSETEADKKKVERMRKALQADLSTTLVNWAPGVPARCFARKFGAWIGRPAQYQARISGDAFSIAFDRKDDVSPVVAFGLGFSPNAYVSILAGATYSTAEVRSDPDDAMAMNDESIWTFTVGLGLNADVLTLLKIQ